MKKYVWYLMILLSLFLMGYLIKSNLINGYRTENANIFSERYLRKVDFQYSNIIDSSVKNDLENMLIKEGISNNRIETFLNYVESFYKVDYPGAIIDGYATTDIKSFSKNNYKINDFLDHWKKLGFSEDDLDINCRVAAFTLIQDLVHIPYNEKLEERLDDELLDRNPLIKWDNETENKYSMLYNNITINSEDNAKGMSSQISQYFNDNKVTFNYDNNVSSLVMYVKEKHNDFVTVAHGCVMIQANDGIYIIEKYNPQTPYQISLFSKIQDVNLYLVSRLNKAKLKSVENIFIFSNDSCIFTLKE